LIKEKKISILISTFNKSKFIKKTIESCLSQKYKNYEIIVVDTNSTDNTNKILNYYSKAKKIKTKYIKRKFKKSPLNQIQAIKVGLEMSKGSIVCLLDGDDIFKKNKLKEINKVFQKNNSLNFVQDIFKHNKINKIYTKLDRYFLFFKILPKFYPTSTFSIRKNELKFFFKKYRNYNLDLLEIDARLFFYSRLFKKNHFFINKSLTFYTKDPNGISSKFKRFSKEWLKKRNQAHIFLKPFFMNKEYPYKIDFFITKFFYSLISKF
jgi:glycosyltransferase involved in cell wall biosynthesis